MPNSDLAHQWTDEELERLERRIARVYREARNELNETVKAYFESFRKRDEEMRALIGTIQNGKEWTEQDYKQWRLNQIGRGKRFEDLVSKVAERYTKANEVAIAYVNDTTPSVYALNRNYAAYTIEQLSGNIGFTLWDESTVKRLIKDDPDVMPYYPKERAVKRGIDLKYGQRQIKKSVTSGILQGKSVGQIAKDLQARVSEMNRASAVRAARTAITSAQNGGRMDSYKAASDMGIKVRKRWVATKDGRTRHAHQKLDGQTVDWDKPFNSELGKIRFPGDPRAKPALTYNCRCTLRTVEKPGIEAEPRKMRVQTPEYTKALEAEEKEKNRLNYLRKRILEETDAQKLIGLEKREKELQKSVNALEKKRKATQKNVVVNEMTYDEWERWVKSRG